MPDGHDPSLGLAQSFPEKITRGRGDGGVARAMDHEDGDVLHRAGGVDAVERGMIEIVLCITFVEVDISQFINIATAAYEQYPDRVDPIGVGTFIRNGVGIRPAADEDGGVVGVGFVGDDGRERFKGLSLGEGRALPSISAMVALLSNAVERDRCVAASFKTTVVLRLAAL